MIVGGPVLYDLADTGEVMRWYRDLLPVAAGGAAAAGRLAHRAAGAAVPGEPLGTQGLRHRLVLHRDRTTGADEVLAAVRAFGSPLLVGRQADAVPGAAERVRRALPGRPAVVLAGGLLQRDLGRGHRRCTPSTARQLPTGQSTMHLYPIDGAASAGRHGRHRVRLPGRRVGRGHRRGRPGPGQRRPIRQWAWTTATGLHPTRPAGPTSTS